MVGNKLEALPLAPSEDKLYLEWYHSRKLWDATTKSKKHLVQHYNSLLYENAFYFLELTINYPSDVTEYNTIKLNFPFYTHLS